MTAADTPDALHGPLRLLVCGDSHAANRRLIKQLKHAASAHHRDFVITEMTDSEQVPALAAARPEAAVLRIDPEQGISPGNRRHALLAASLGIRHLVLAVDTADPAAFLQSTLRDLEDAFSAHVPTFGCRALAVIPVSVQHGDNIVSPSSRMSWYAGASLSESLGALRRRQADAVPLVFQVWQAARLDDRQAIVSGTVADGEVRVGEEIRITASGLTSTVSTILAEGDTVTYATTGTDVTLQLDPPVAISHGDILSPARHPLETTDQFEATLIWLDRDAGLTGRRYGIGLAGQTAAASITAIKYRVNPANLGHEPVRKLERDDIAVCNVAIDRPLAFDSHERSAVLGHFTLTDRVSRATVAIGLIHHSLRRAQNVHRQALSIARADRERLNGHRGKVVWFTGLSGSGKSTLANALEAQLHRQGKRTYILDGDNVRQGLNKDLGFTDADRVENIRRIAEVAKLMMDAGLIVMTAFISPFRRERAMARELIGTEHFIEVFVDTPLQVCEARDPKGLYKKARSGQLPNMTGIGSPYEAPEHPDLTVDFAEDNLIAAVTALETRLLADEAPT